MSPIVERLFQLMNDRHLKAAKVTRDLRISNSSFSDWKSGKASPGVDALSKLARYFGVSLDYLITGREYESEELMPVKAPETVVIFNPEDRELVSKYRRLPADCQVKIMVYVDGMLAASQPRQTAEASAGSESQMPVGS